MVTFDQIKRGAARYLDEEFTSQLNGWQKWAIGAGGAMALNNLDTILLSLRDHPASRLIGVFDEAGNVDLDRVYAYVKIEAEKAPVTFSVPFLGPVTLKAQDVETLYTCIVQA